VQADWEREREREGEGQEKTMDEVWVTQMEGFLLKRGAGYKKERDREREEESRARGGSFLGIATKGIRGKGSSEKKRYFILVTMMGDSGIRPKAELRYFTQRRLADAAVKGKVILDASMRVELQGHSTVCLVTRKRTYYLRPDKSFGEKDSAKARVIGGQWLHALEYALNLFYEFEMKNEEGHNEDFFKAPSIRMISTRLTEEDLRRHRQEVARALSTSKKKKDKKPQTDKEKLVDSSQKQQALWDDFGLEAYNSIVAHFGPILVDMKRLEDHLMVRIKMSEAEVALFQNHQLQSQDIAVPEQATSARMIALVYKMLEKRAQNLSSHVKKLQADVLQPIVKFQAKIYEELDKLVDFHHGTTSNIERLYKGIYEMKHDIRELETAYDHVISGMGGNTRKTRGGSMLGRSSFTGTSGAIAGAAVASNDPDEIAKEIEHSKELLTQTQAALRKEETKHAKRMKMALASLHGLEVERLNVQKKCLMKLAEHERALRNLAEKALGDGSTAFKIVDQVNPVKDVEATSIKLLKSLS